MAQLVKNPPAMQETPVRFLGQEDPLEKGLDKKKRTFYHMLKRRGPFIIIYGFNPF